MDMKKISAACATAAALAALCVPGSAAFAADGTLTLNAGDGSTLAGHSFTVYKVAGYNDVVKDGANVKSVSASSPDATTDAWVKAALNKNGVTYNTSEGRNAAEQLLRLKTNSNTLRKVAGTLQSTAASSKVAAVKTNQTSATGSLNLTLPEGYYLVVDAQGIPILVSTTIGGSVRMSNGQTLGSTQIKTNVTKIDKKIKSVDGTWKDSAAATNGETRDFKATFTVPNKLAVDTITLEDHMTGIVYVDGSFHAATSSGMDVTNQFGTIGKDKVGNSDGTGFKVTSLQSLVDTVQGKQVTVTYQGKVVNASKANQGLNQILITSNWLPNVVPPDVPTPNPGTDETPVPTYDVNLKKISAADGNKVIQGAKFKLHNDSLNQWYVWNTSSNQWTFTTDESKATEFSTNASGVINFTRLGAGDYTVKETQVPTGYFSFVKPSFGIHITDDGHVTITGKDQPGLTGKVTNADGKTTTPTAVVKNIDNITQLPQTGATTMGVYSDEQKLENAAGAAARALGYSEIITYSFVSPSSFDAIRIPADSPLRKTVKLVNPLGEDTSIMRTVILPSMLDILSRNFAFKNKGVKLYEIGKIYLPVEGEKLPNEPKRMIFGTYGEHENFFTLKGEVDALLEQLNVHPATYVADTKNPSYHPGRCADIMIDGKKLGVIGQIHPLVAEGYGISGEVYVAELDFTGLQSALAPERVFHSLPKFPTVSRDLALVCDEAMTVGMLEACIKKAGGKLLRSIQLFDIYRGPGIAPGKKSVAFSLELRADDRTLTDEDTTGVTNAVLEKLKNDLGVTLR